MLTKVRIAKIILKHKIQMLQEINADLDKEVKEDNLDYDSKLANEFIEYCVENVDDIDDHLHEECAKEIAQLRSEVEKAEDSLEWLYMGKDYADVD